MIDFPDAAWNKQQLTQHLTHITQLLRADVFRRTSPFTNQTQAHWIELIRSVSDLVRQALRAGRRIDFTEDVGTQGKPQDITSLLDSMRRSAYVVGLGTQPGLTIISPALNHFYGMGMGYFANGLFFRCEHENELAFFIGRDRIYFYRHLVRAFVQAGQYLTSVSERE
ncbi:hypothetical protein [Spirosoma areae]